MARAKRSVKWDNFLGLSDESKRWIEDIQKETDRGVALVAAAFFDDVLGAMLRARLIDAPKEANKLLQYPGPVSSFAYRIDLAYLLGLLGSKTRDALHIVREIRNHFAHSHVPVTFEDAHIEQLCTKLVVYPRNQLPFDLKWIPAVGSFSTPCCCRAHSRCTVRRWNTWRRGVIHRQPVPLPRRRKKLRPVDTVA